MTMNSALLMNKKFWSVFLAVISAIALLTMVAAGVSTGASIDAVENTEHSAENFLGALIAVFAAWLGFFVAVIALAAIGFAASLGGMKLAQSPAVKTLSEVLLCIHSAVAVISILCFVYFVFA